MRLIVYSTLDGSREGVFFTEDLDSAAGDFCPVGCQVDHDTIIDGTDFPSGFPLEYNLERTF